MRQPSAKALLFVLTAGLALDNAAAAGDRELGQYLSSECVTCHRASGQNAQGIPKITEWKKRIGDVPLVAIGGIKFEQAAAIFAAGADSIAVVSDVTQNADPDARVRQWLGQNAKAA